MGGPAPCLLTVLLIVNCTAIPTYNHFYHRSSYDLHFGDAPSLLKPKMRLNWLVHKNSEIGIYQLKLMQRPYTQDARRIRSIQYLFLCRIRSDLALKHQPEAGDVRGSYLAVEVCRVWSIEMHGWEWMRLTTTVEGGGWRQSWRKNGRFGFIPIVKIHK